MKGEHGGGGGKQKKLLRLLSLSFSLSFSSSLLFFFRSFSSSLTSQRIEHDESRVPQPHQRPGDLRAHFLERIEGITEHLGAAPAEEQRDEVELEVDRADFEQRDGPRRASNGGEVDDAPEGPDAREDLDD